jgi:hypothetical protein
VVALAVFLRTIMTPRTSKKHRPTVLDSVCGYCLFFQPQTANPGALRSGNCCYHKEWIENAYRTTCSDMSRDRLADGIYHLVAGDNSSWQYIRRAKKLRTRLFSVK